MIGFVSTRGGEADAVPFSTALLRGLAPDGGLYVPTEFPEFDAGDFTGEESLPEIAARVLAPFFVSDPLFDHLEQIAHGSLDFPIPLSFCTPGDAPRAPAGAAVLELFHGATAAFKDVGARFLAECFARCEDEPRRVLVATSGDTGGAVAAAFHGRPSVDVAILFPRGGVSKDQEHQLTCFGGNVHAFAVDGKFDDCQRILKEALADGSWPTDRQLTTANSINIARLLPQLVYYAWAGLRYCREQSAVPSFVIPAGNVGNATAALWAKRMGFPIGHVLLACNANRTIPDYFASGDWLPRPAVRTLANAMDVGNPSNMERVFHLFPNLVHLTKSVSAAAVEDTVIERTIREGVEGWGRVFDPHTATAAHLLETRPEIGPAIVVATAHPAKFRDVVEPLIGRPVEVPANLRELMQRDTSCVGIDADLPSLRAALP